MRRGQEIHNEIIEREFDLDPCLESRIVRIMEKHLVRKIFDMCQDIADREDKEAYKNFWNNFGRSIKLGCIENSANHKRLTPLLRSMKMNWLV